MPRGNKKIEFAIELIENEIKAADGNIQLNITSENYGKAFGLVEYKAGLERALSFIKPCGGAK